MSCTAGSVVAVPAWLAAALAAALAQKRRAVLWPATLLEALPANLAAADNIDWFGLLLLCKLFDDSLQRFTDEKCLPLGVKGRVKRRRRRACCSRLGWVRGAAAFPR